VLASRHKQREQLRSPENQPAVLTGYVLLIIVQQQSAATAPHSTDPI
jgi:hypothetical protein